MISKVSALCCLFRSAVGQSEAHFPNLATCAGRTSPQQTRAQPPNAREGKKSSTTRSLHLLAEESTKELNASRSESARQGPKKVKRKRPVLTAIKFYYGPKPAKRGPPAPQIISTQSQRGIRITDPLRLPVDESGGTSFTSESANESRRKLRITDPLRLPVDKLVDTSSTSGSASYPSKTASSHDQQVPDLDNLSNSEDARSVAESQPVPPKKPTTKVICHHISCQRHICR